MLLLILESLGSTELVFILIMALVFFGPRKLPQISRSLGKNLAEFRRASEEFKRTWDKEVSLEEAPGTNGSTPAGETSPVDSVGVARQLPAPSISIIPPEQVIARQAQGAESIHSSAQSDLIAEHLEFESPTDEPRHSPKNDWL